MAHPPKKKDRQERALKDIGSMMGEREKTPQGKVRLIEKKSTLARQIDKLGLPKSHPAFRATSVKQFNQLLNKHPIRATIKGR
jgi:hypothetical protein